MKTVKLELTENEFQALSGFLDAGVRANGLRGVPAAAVLLSKFDQALQRFQAENGAVGAIDPSSDEASKPNRKARRAAAARVKANGKADDELAVT